MILACASHFLVDLPLFGGPVLLVAAAAVVMARVERRRATDATDAIDDIDTAGVLR